MHDADDRVPGDNVATADAVDHVKALLEASSAVDLTDDELKATLQSELNTLVERLQHVRALSNHYGGIELSPFVRGLARQMELEVEVCGPDGDSARPEGR